MHEEQTESLTHDHVFGQDDRRAGERRMLIVIVITAVTMLAEIVAGMAFGSMALLADGLHMASHASALAISAYAYFYTRRHAADSRFNFGTGKVNSLAAFASAVMLVCFTLLMAWESVARLVSPVTISFNQAIFVVVIGLVVNLACLVVLGGHGHSHEEDDVGHGTHDHGEPGHSAYHEDLHDEEHGRHTDLNLFSAYIHVLADAMTSILAIVALLAGKYWGQNWLDPFMGLVGAALVVHWALGLLRSSSHVLLDMRIPEAKQAEIRTALEENGDNVVEDLHVWSIGPGIFAAEAVIRSATFRESSFFAARIPQELGVVHTTIEVRKKDEEL